MTSRRLPNRSRPSQLAALRQRLCGLRLCGLRVSATLRTHVFDNFTNPETRCETFTILSCSGLTFFGIEWNVGESSLRPIVIPSISFILVAICIAPLFLYCTALWIDS